jgi:transcriptional regulator with XRE-family HTH domain
MSPEQCRAARSLLGWSQEELATSSHVSKFTVIRFENRDRNPYASTVNKMRDVLILAGIIFIDDDGVHGEGVRFAKSKLKHEHKNVDVTQSSTPTPFEDPVRGPVARAVFQRGRWFSLPRQTRRILRAWLFADRYGPGNTQPSK